MLIDTLSSREICLAGLLMKMRIPKNRQFLTDEDLKTSPYGFVKVRIRAPTIPQALISEEQKMHLK